MIISSSRPWVRQKAGWRRPSGFEQASAGAISAYLVSESFSISFQIIGELGQVLNGFSAEIRLGDLGSPTLFCGDGDPSAPTS